MMFAYNIMTDLFIYLSFFFVLIFVYTIVCPEAPVKNDYYNDVVVILF